MLDEVAVTERACTMDDLRAATEAFLASTTREVQSIAAVEEIELGEGDRTREAQAALRARIERAGRLGIGVRSLPALARARVDPVRHVPRHVLDHVRGEAEHAAGASEELPAHPQPS